MKNLPHNKVVLGDIRKTLDQQVNLIDFPTRSRLRQARFYAIDHGLMSKRSNLLNLSQYAVRAVVAVYVFGITLMVVMNPFNASVLSDNNVAPRALPLFDEAKMNILISSDDTEEDIEIYNWLYERYG